MSGTLRARLQEQLARFDDEGFAALGNRGLLRRAHKDLERLQVAVSEENAESLVVTVGPQRIRFDARGVAQARCDCAGSGVCQHILAAAISLQKLVAEAPGDPTGDAPPGPAAGSAAAGPLQALRDALLAMPSAALVQHAGKAGYRWAWQFVHDLDAPDALQVSGEKHLVLSLHRPRLTLRYMGGGLDALIADVALASIEKYRVAAVLALQRAHGRTLTPPEPSVAARHQALDLGTDHRLAGTGAATLEASRQRLRDSARQLFAEAVELGLAHLSSAMLERCTTLAVWAQGAEYHRLALLLRRVADHVDLLLQRAGGADEHWLLDELSLANALVDALAAAAARGLAPAQLVGRARTHYDETGTLELQGLGARPWRSASGYVGLSMLFWSARDGFMACTDARPEALRGFDPIARYTAPGPWSGLGAPQRATGQRLALVGAQLNEAMRLSARDSTSATLLPADPRAWSAEQLGPSTRWAALAAARSAGHSLLTRPAAMQDWAFLQPSQLGACCFDHARQTLLWPLVDAEGQVLRAELPFDRCNAHAMQRIEALPSGENVEGLIVVAQLQGRQGSLVAQPLSLVRPGAAMPVDALHFDGEPAPAGMAARLGQAWAARGTAPLALQPPMPQPAVLVEARHCLQRLAERGLPASAAPAWTAELDRLVERTRAAGLTAFAALGPAPSAGLRLLRLNHLRMEFESQRGDAAASLE